MRQSLSKREKNKDWIGLYFPQSNSLSVWDKWLAWALQHPEIREVGPFVRTKNFHVAYGDVWKKVNKWNQK